MAIVKPGLGLLCVAGLASTQILLAVILAAIISTKLDGQPDAGGSTGDGGGGYCVLNVTPGRVCDFVYVTCGFGMFWSLLLLIPSLLALRQTKLPYLHPIVASLAAFATFWWVVEATTITIRGDQADSDSLPGGSARTAAAALSWLEVALFALTAAAGILDRVMAYRQAGTEKSRSLLDMEQHDQFKTTHVHTRMGNTPLA